MPNLHFINFLRPVATVTDKLIRASPYHGCRVRVIAFCLAFPVHSFDCLWFYREHFKTFCEAFVVEFYLKLKPILRIITYLTYICWEIDNFVIKSDIFRRFVYKNILKKLSCYHDNCSRYFMFGKYNGFVSKARVSACMYFLVYIQYIQCMCITRSYNSSVTYFEFFCMVSKLYTYKRTSCCRQRALIMYAVVLT